LGLYLYCVIPSTTRREFGNIGIGDIPVKVFTIHFQDLALVVSRSAAKTYDPTRKYAMAHEKVISTVMKEYPVVPMSFGLVCKDEKLAEQVLIKNYSVLMEKLELFTGRLEVGLKVWWKKDIFQDEMFRVNPRLAALKKQIEAKTTSETYIKTVEFGKLVQQTADEQRSSYEREIFKPLQGLAVAAKLNKLIGELMVFNAAFLIDKSREHEFDLKVNELYLAHQDKLNFKYTGPWPPYNFVEIHIKDV